jgi:hypothetical protein
LRHDARAAGRTLGRHQLAHEVPQAECQAGAVTVKRDPGAAALMESNPNLEYELGELVEKIADMPQLPGLIVEQPAQGSLLGNVVPIFGTGFKFTPDQVAFMADAWAHAASYVAGIVGGLVLIGYAGARRLRLARAAADW